MCFRGSPAHSPGSAPGSAGRAARNGSIPNFRPARSRNNGPCVPRRLLLPHAAPAALQTLSFLFALAGEAAEQQVFPAIGCHPRLAGDTLLQPRIPGTPKGPDTPWGQSRDPQRLLSLSRQVALLQRDSSSSTHPPAVHILLEKISLLRFQVPAKMRLKNVQNAVFASFPLCVSQRVLQTGTSS